MNESNLNSDIKSSKQIDNTPCNVFEQNLINQTETLDIKQTETIGIKLAPYNPTNVDACNIALDILSIGENDILYDLGCGDGRLLVEGCLRISSLQAVGVEFDSSLCFKAVQNIKEKEVSNRAKIIHDNVLNIDISPATAIFIYLVPEGMKALAPTLITGNIYLFIYF
jgi:tRNA G46 methylase TrmB